MAWVTNVMTREESSKPTSSTSLIVYGALSRENSINLADRTAH